MDWIGMGWIGLEWVGMGWIVFDCIGLERNSLKVFTSILLRRVQSRS